MAGRGATLLQFSTEVCAPCRTTHSILDELAEHRGDVSHVDIDITRRVDLASRFTLLLLVRAGILGRRPAPAA